LNKKGCGILFLVYSSRMNITRISPLSGKVNTLDIPATLEQFAAYEAGALIQNAFPNLTPDEREFIKTGITPEEWDAAFGGLDEE
jgi:hypothetical protein